MNKFTLEKSADGMGMDSYISAAFCYLKFILYAISYPQWISNVIMTLKMDGVIFIFGSSEMKFSVQLLLKNFGKIMV